MQSEPERVPWGSLVAAFAFLVAVLAFFLTPILVEMSRYEEGSSVVDVKQLSTVPEISVRATTEITTARNSNGRSTSAIVWLTRSVDDNHRSPSITVNFTWGSSEISCYRHGGRLWHDPVGEEVSYSVNCSRWIPVYLLTEVGPTSVSVTW
jgi:hypothetical protein